MPDRPAARADAPRTRFLCDRMLGRLCRWLRMMGEDAAYAPDTLDAELLHAAASEGRVLLTRDRGLADRAGDRALYIAAHGLREQTLEFVARFGMPEEWFTRCTTCNGPLSEDEPGGCSGAMPEGIEHRHAAIWTCRRCGQRYWPGTQHAAVTECLELLTAESRAGEEGADGP